jgi:tetratricopeptide (TPR) repeat protein
MTRKRPARQRRSTSAKAAPKKANGRSVFLFFLFVFSALLYANTLGHQYAFDDSIVITENPYTQSGLKGIPKLLTTDFFEGIYGYQTDLSGGRYRPLSLTSFAIEYQLFGENPLPGHFFNILLYALCVLMTFLVLEQWFGRSSTIPYFSSLLFLVHPVHTEVVANIKSRDEILCFLLLFGALYWFYRWISDGRDGKILAFSCICFFLSLMAKETAITFIPVFCLIGFYFEKQPLRSSIRAGLPFLVVAIAYFMLRVSIVGMVGGNDSADIMENPFVNSGFMEKYGTISVLLFKYLSLLFFPHPLTSDYSFNHVPFVDFGSPVALLGLLIYLFLGIYMVARLRNRDVLALAILLYLAPLSIVSNIVFNVGAPMGERFLFLPSFGFVVGVSALLDQWLLDGEETASPIRAISASKAVLALLAISVCLLSVKTISRNADWYDNSTLFAKDIVTSVDSAKMQYFFANTFVNRYMGGKKAENKPLLGIAEKHLKKSLRINPDFVSSLYTLGLVYASLDQGQLARSYLDETLIRQPGHRKASQLLGEVHGRLLGDYDQALYYLEAARDEFGDTEPGLLLNLGNVYAVKGDFQQAILIFEELIQSDPKNAEYHVNMGLTYQSMGDQAKAESYFSRAMELDPTLSD